MNKLTFVITNLWNYFQTQHMRKITLGKANLCNRGLDSILIQYIVHLLFHRICILHHMQTGVVQIPCKIPLENVHIHVEFLAHHR